MINDLSAVVQRPSGDGAHQAGFSAAKNELPPLGGVALAKRVGGVHEALIEGLSAEPAYGNGFSNRSHINPSNYTFVGAMSKQKHKACIVSKV